MADEKILREFSKYWKRPKDDNMQDFVNGITGRAVLETKKYISRRYGESIPSSEVIFDEYYEMFKRTDETFASLSDMYVLRVIKEFFNNPNMLFKALEAEKDSKSFWVKDNRQTYKYTSDQNANRRIFAYDIFHNFNDYEGNKFDKAKLLNLTPEIKEKLILHLIPQLKEIYKDRLQDLIDCYVNGIVNTLGILEKIGVLEANIWKNNSERQEMGLGILSFEYENTRASDKYCVKQLTEPEFLRKLPFEKLVLIYGFYSNRLKKIADTLGMGLFICDKIGDFDINNKNEDENEIMSAYLQYNVINELYEEATPKIYSDIERYVIADGYEGKKYVAVSFDKIYEDFFEKYKDAYSAYSGGESDLNKDFETYYYTQVTDYWKKDYSIETVLLIALDSFQKVNWGYIPETQHGENSIKRNKENILLGFDIDGFNMPVRLHMPLDKVKSFFKNSNSGHTIPNYIGNEDMILWDKNIGASILMPLSPKHRKQVISFVKGLNPKSYYYNFAKHIQCMQYENSLIRLQRWKDPNGRKGDRVYTNLLTGEEETPVRQK